MKDYIQNIVTAFLVVLIWIVAGIIFNQGAAGVPSAAVLLSVWLLITLFVYDYSILKFLKYGLIYLLPWFILPFGVWVHSEFVSSMSIFMGGVARVVVLVRTAANSDRFNIKSDFSNAASRKTSIVPAEVFSWELVAQKNEANIVDLVLCGPSLRDVQHVAQVTMRLTADNEHQFAPGRAVRIVIDSRGRVLTVNDDNPLGVFWSGRRLKQAAIFSYALLTLSYPFLYGQGMDVFTPIHPWVVIPWVTLFFDKWQYRRFSEPFRDRLSARNIIEAVNAYYYLYGKRVNARLDSVKSTGAYFDNLPQVVITLTFTVSETGESLMLSQTRLVSHSDLPVLGRSHLALFYWPGSPKDYRLPQLIEPMISYRHAQEEWWATRNIPDGW